MLEEQKLELTWIGKYDVGAGFMPALEPRILIEYPKKSYGIVGAGPRACPNDEQLNQRGQLQGQPQGQLKGQPQGVAPTLGGINNSGQLTYERGPVKLS